MVYYWGMPKPPPGKTGVSEDAFAIMVMIYYAAAKASRGEHSVPPGPEAVEAATEQTQLIVDHLAIYTPPT